MGEEVRQERFGEADFARFAARLGEETEALGRWFEASDPEESGECAGFELELCLVDGRQQPAPENQAILAAVADPHLVPELSRFNLELNSDPHPVEPGLLSALRAELEALGARVDREAEGRGLRFLMIGTLPTLPEEALTLENMSPLHRYHLLNDEVLRQRRGRPLHLDIRGRERLVTDHQDVMLEAAATSLQVHLQVPLSRSRRFFNAALVASAPMVGLAANSPYLFGKDLWAETRIPLFEQAVGCNPPLGRVTFGGGYARDSLYELFLENLREYPVMLPARLDGSPDTFPHLRLHNGTIWRWNRPIVAPDASGAIRLRIEHRVMAAGPSVPDVVANIAAYLGLVHVLAEAEEPPESRLSFEAARANFYAAAEGGLDAEVLRLDGRRGSLREWWLGELLPVARQGLRGLGLDPEDTAFYLEEVLFPRLRSGQNGAAWQRAFVARHGADFSQLVGAYGQGQRSGRPVHAWGL
ncbi:MAG: glutamate--cysteine ligase [Deltaproteobacteria bacterium]|nr:glutamate--cysteine ligase [Deltaproteobacteria bacterium]